MHTQNLIIAAGLIIGFALLAFFINKALKHALRNAYGTGKTAGIADSNARMNALNTDLASLATRRDRERKDFLETVERKNHLIKKLQQQLATAEASTLTTADLNTLLSILGTLDMAHQTWLPIRGTEPWRAKAAGQIKQLNTIANRILDGFNNSRPPLVIEQPPQAPGKAA